MFLSKICLHWKSSGVDFDNHYVLGIATQFQLHFEALTNNGGISNIFFSLELLVS